jgi:hypothetical protein
LILVVGRIKDFPTALAENENVRIWDDNSQEWTNKTVPLSTRGILTTKFVSHANLARLKSDAKSLGIPVFPRLKPREIRQVLSSIMPEEPRTDAEATSTEAASTPAETEEIAMRPPKRGEVPEFLMAELAVSALVSDEARRLLPILKKKGITLTSKALEQHIRKVRDVKSASPARKTDAKRPVATKKTGSKLPTGVIDEFAEAERLLQDARVALDLALAVIPKLREQMTRVQERQERLRAALVDLNT